MRQVFLSKTKQHLSNVPFPGLLQPCLGVCSTRLHRVRTFRLHPIIFHWLLGPATLLHHRAFQKVTRDFWDSRSTAPSLSLPSVGHSELLTAPFLEMHFWLQELYTPLVFLFIYLAASLQSHLCFSVSKSQNSSRSSPRVLLTSILPHPSAMPTILVIIYVTIPNLYIYSSDLCFKLQIHMLDCSLHVLQILVDQHAHNWNHLFPSFAYLFQLSNLHGPYLKR